MPAFCRSTISLSIECVADGDRCNGLGVEDHAILLNTPLVAAAAAPYGRGRPRVEAVR
jgi:hypothetical protein